MQIGVSGPFLQSHCDTLPLCVRGSPAVPLLTGWPGGWPSNLIEMGHSIDGLNTVLASVLPPVSLWSPFQDQQLNGGGSVDVGSVYGSVYLPYGYTRSGCTFSATAYSATFTANDWQVSDFHNEDDTWTSLADLPSYPDIISDTIAQQLQDNYPTNSYDGSHFDVNNYTGTFGGLTVSVTLSVTSRDPFNHQTFFHLEVSVQAAITYAGYRLQTQSFTPVPIGVGTWNPAPTCDSGSDWTYTQTYAATNIQLANHPAADNEFYGGYALPTQAELDFILSNISMDLFCNNYSAQTQVYSTEGKEMFKIQMDSCPFPTKELVLTSGDTPTGPYSTYTANLIVHIHGTMVSHNPCNCYVAPTVAQIDAAWEAYVTTGLPWPLPWLPPDIPHAITQADNYGCADKPTCAYCHWAGFTELAPITAIDYYDPMLDGGLDFCKVCAGMGKGEGYYAYRVTIVYEWTYTFTGCDNKDSNSG